MRRLILSALALLLPVSAHAADPVLIPGTLGTGMCLTAGEVRLCGVPSDKSAAGQPIESSDGSKQVELGPFTYTLPRAGSPGFGEGWGTCLLNVSPSGNATVNTTGSVFRGAGGGASVTLRPDEWICPSTKAGNWLTFKSGSASGGAGAPSFITFSSGGIAISPQTKYIGQGYAGTLAALAGQWTAPRAGTVSGLTCTPSSAPGPGSSLTFSLVVNGVDNANQRAIVTDAGSAPAPGNAPVPIPAESKLTIYLSGSSGTSPFVRVVCTMAFQ